MRRPGSESPRVSTCLKAWLQPITGFRAQSVARSARDRSPLAVLVLALVVAAVTGYAQRPLALPSLENEGQTSAQASLPDRLADSYNRVIDGYVRRGYDYLSGRGVPQDPAQAVYWFRKAADLGHPGAQNEMGYFNLFGIGVPRDEASAASWYMRAASGGSRPAKLNLAVLYLNGTGVARDPALAANLLRELAAKNDPRAKAYLGVLYYTGLGVTRDRVLAEKWFRKAAHKKSIDADYAIGTILLSAGDDAPSRVKAAQYLRSAASAGYMPAVSALGILLVRNPDISQQSPDEGIRLLERAAEAGRWESSAALGVAARDGTGAPREMGEAFRWFSIAARQGGAEAEERTQADLARCREALPADRQAELSAQVEAWLAQHPGHGAYLLKNGIRVSPASSQIGAD